MIYRRIRKEDGLVTRYGPWTSYLAQEVHSWFSQARALSYSPAAGRKLIEMRIEKRNIFSKLLETFLAQSNHSGEIARKIAISIWILSWLRGIELKEIRFDRIWLVIKNFHRLLRKEREKRWRLAQELLKVTSETGNLQTNPETDCKREQFRFRCKRTWRLYLHVNYRFFAGGFPPRPLHSFRECSFGVKQPRQQFAEAEATTNNNVQLKIVRN